MNTCKTCQHWYCEQGMKKYNVGVCSEVVVQRRKTDTINMDVNASRAEKDKPTAFCINLGGDKALVDFYTPAGWFCPRFEERNK